MHLSDFTAAEPKLQGMMHGLLTILPPHVVQQAAAIFRTQRALRTVFDIEENGTTLKATVMCEKGERPCLHQKALPILPAACCFPS